jgi:apolipoprotein N-acyltransferase
LNDPPRIRSNELAGISPPLSVKTTFVLPHLPLPFLIVVAALFYNAALWFQPGAVWLTAASATALCAMVRAKTARRAFYGGIAAALAIYVPHLWFLTTIFDLIAIPLWLSIALWPGLFCGTLHVLHRKWGVAPALAAAPLLWMGLEYYRSEVWLLKFSWLTPGFALPAESMGWLYQSLGTYGSGALLVLAGAAFVLLKKPAALAAGLLLPALLLPGQRTVVPAGSVRITGVQFEEVMDNQRMDGLEAARAAWPDTQVFILPEYSFSAGVPADFLNWCRTHKCWLIAGGKDYQAGQKNRHGNTAYFNTAFVVGPEGTVVHRQAKAMPIQFFDDGEAAVRQEVWVSPWGKLGICICYDQNYATVTDPLAAQQMQALLIPTMDLRTWGQHQHWLSARLAATRAAEYGVPVLRLASSGFSTFTDAKGHELAKGSMPGHGDVVSALIPLSAAPHQPWDRIPAKAAGPVAGLLILLALTVSFIDELRRKRSGNP